MQDLHPALFRRPCNFHRAPFRAHARHALSPSHTAFTHNGRELIIRVEVSACPECPRMKSVTNPTFRCMYMRALNVRKRKSDRSLFIVQPRRTSPSSVPPY